MHNLSKLMSFGYAVIQTNLSCVKFRHTIPIYLGTTQIPKLSVLTTSSQKLYFQLY